MIRHAFTLPHSDLKFLHTELAKGGSCEIIIKEYSVLGSHKNSVPDVVIKVDADEQYLGALTGYYEGRAYPVVKASNPRTIFTEKDIITYLCTRLMNSPMEFDVSGPSDHNWYRIRYEIKVRPAHPYKGRGPRFVPAIDAQDAIRVVLADEYVHAVWPTQKSMRRELSRVMRKALRRLRGLCGRKPKKPPVMLS